MRLSSGHEEEVHLSVDFFGRGVRTRPAPASFPLYFYESFQTSKIYTRCYNLNDVFHALKDELIQIALVQVGYSGLPKDLATYESNLHDFLFPLSNFVSSSSGAEREILLSPSKHFPGVIGPRLEFSTHTIIHEGSECVLNSGRRLLSTERIGRPFARHYIDAENWNQEESVQMEDRPPFVVRKARTILCCTVIKLSFR